MTELARALPTRLHACGMPPTTIAVIGGGITGLSAAFHLSRRFPQAQICLLEKSAREGGWIRSRRVDVQGYNGEKANVLLETGSRTLRPNSGAVLELVRHSFLFNQHTLKWHERKF